MLRKIRTILAAVFIVLITLLFLDFTGTLHHWLGWMAKIQFLPAVMALNVVSRTFWHDSVGKRISMAIRKK